MCLDCGRKLENLVKTQQGGHEDSTQKDPRSPEQGSSGCEAPPEPRCSSSLLFLFKCCCSSAVSVMAVLRELLWICALLCLTTGQTEVTARAKEHAVLQCQSPTGGRISVLKWSRPGLKSAGYVYFYRNNRRFDSYQHPSFHGRVQLREPDMRDGDASLILSNVTEEDAGKYECYVSASGPETSCFINLIVTGETSQTAEKLEFMGGHAKDAVTVETSSRLVAAVVVAVVVVVVLVSVGLWRVTKRRQVTRQHAPVKGLCEAEEQ